ncbi:MAG: DUF6677 family protein [Planctomycetota bacterium]
MTTTKKHSVWLSGLLAWLLPGLGHWMLGRHRRAIALCASVMVLYLAGLFASQKWSLIANDFVGLDIRLGPIHIPSSILDPLAAVPESFIGLPNFIAHGTLQFDARGEPSLEPKALVGGLTIGLLLSALAGLINIIGVADAVTIAGDRTGRLTGPGRREPFWGVLLSWLLPGAGHVYAGHRNKGILVGSLVVGAFVIGLILGDGCVLDRQRYPYYFLATMFQGLPTLVGGVATAGFQVDESVDPRRLEVGLLFVGVAGLMNLLVMIDSYNLIESKNLGRAADASGTAPAQPEVVAKKS